MFAYTNALGMSITSKQAHQMYAEAMEYTTLVTIGGITYTTADLMQTSDYSRYLIGFTDWLNTMGWINIH